MLKKLFPTLGAAASAFVITISPDVQHLIASHATLSGILGSAFAIVAHLLPSPLQSSEKANQ